MKRIFSIVLLAFLVHTTTAQAQETLREFALFDYNSYELTPAAKTLIDGMMREVNGSVVTKIELYGHTDSDGDPAANKVLSENRVNAVKQYLLGKGYDQKIIVTNSYGEEKPAFSNASDDGMHKNRRVEIAFTYEKPKEVAVIRPSVEAEQGEPIDISVTKKETLTTLPVEGDTQRFVVSTDRHFRITGKNGTIIDFWAEPFVDAKGKGVSGEVTIILIEVYTKPEMIQHNLNTTSGFQLLESAGMVYIAAEKDGKSLSLNPNAPYTIMFPTSDKQQDMNIFYADTVAERTTWTQAERKFLFDQTYIQHNDSLDKYVFNGTKLGWVNCDHFLKMKNLTELTVICADTGLINFYLIFQKYNSVMWPQAIPPKMQFLNVPVGETATIVAIKKNASGTFYYSKEIVIEKNQEETAVLKKITQEEFEKRIAELK